jgi:formamidopyrimidine-DNA glycosylase
MPELPEVETIIRVLKNGSDKNDHERSTPSLSGCILTDGQILWARTLAQPGVDQFPAAIRGQQINEISRRGKFIVLSLTHDTLLIHLRMSGDLRVEPAFDANGAPCALQKHDRMALTFSNGYRLVFNDTRKFGRVWLVNDVQQVLGSLGPEPLDPHFSADEFHRRLNQRRRQLKPLLLDQSFLAGLGNIYTDEALHLAGLHPLLDSASLDQAAAARLLEAVRAVLQEGIRRNGASIDWVYRGGDFQNAFRVYSRTGQACPVCGFLIERILVGQRSTHFCPSCQSLSPSVTQT